MKNYLSLRRSGSLIAATIILAGAAGWFMYRHWQETVVAQALFEQIADKPELNPTEVDAL